VVVDDDDRPEASLSFGHGNDDNGDCEPNIQRIRLMLNE
jgi:hypothetical protein